jgi:hypothetical protein
LQKPIARSAPFVGLAVPSRITAEGHQASDLFCIELFDLLAQERLCRIAQAAGRRPEGHRRDCR